MLRLFPLILLFAAAVWFVRYFTSRAPRRVGSECLYDAEFRNGRSVGARGQLARAVVNAFEDVAFLSSIDGRVRVLDGNRLEFSDSIPEPVRQQFRNALHAGPR